MEVRIGYDGIVFASDVNGADFALTPADCLQRPRRQGGQGRRAGRQPARSMGRGQPALPDQDDPDLHPRHQARHPRSLRREGDRSGLQGNRRAGPVSQAAPRRGCDKEKKDNAKKCHELRTDGKSVDIDGDYTETLARMDADKNAIGVFGLSFYQNNTDKLKVATMNGRRALDRDRSPRANTRCRVRCSSTSRRPISA
jgi:phosphate transport system substrate-binding protein